MCHTSHSQLLLELELSVLLTCVYNWAAPMRAQGADQEVLKREPHTDDSSTRVLVYHQVNSANESGGSDKLDSASETSDKSDASDASNKSIAYNATDKSNASNTSDSDKSNASNRDTSDTHNKSNASDASNTQDASNGSNASHAQDANNESCAVTGCVTGQVLLVDTMSVLLTMLCLSSPTPETREE
jgi:hypothetical protein